MTSSSEKVFTVLNDYLSFENPLPLDLAVESLLKLLPADAPDSEEIFRFGEDCFEIAEMLSYQSSSHSRLAQLLEALGLSSHFTSLTSEVWICSPGGQQKKTKKEKGKGLDPWKSCELTRFAEWESLAF